MGNPRTLRETADVTVREDESRRFLDHAEQWLQLAQTLDDTFSALETMQRESNVEDRHTAQTDLVARVLKAVLWTSELITQLEGPSAFETGASIAHPTVQLAHAYMAAFEAVGGVTLLIDDLQPKRLATGVTTFMQLADRAAGELHAVVNLLVGRRQLGSVANSCTFISGLEDQADRLFRSQVAVLLRKNAGEGSPWTAQAAHGVRILVALESLTDRCEDIADALLLVRHVL